MEGPRIHDPRGRGLNERSDAAARAHLAGLWRYPVKSLGGEACEALELEARGVAHDRVFAVRTASGKLGSGKSTRRFQPAPSPAWM